MGGRGGGAPKGGAQRGSTRDERLSRRGLAFACQDAVSDEELVEWLLSIAIDGRWPSRARPVQQAGEQYAQYKEITDPTLVAMPPGEGIRKYALEEFIRRRNGQPMQAIQIKAEVEARTRILDNADDVIDVGALDPAAALALEQVFMRALAPVSDDDDSDEIDE